MQEEGKQLSRATFSVSVKNFKRSVGEGLQRDAHGLVEGDGAADGGGNNRAAAALAMAINRALNPSLTQEDFAALVS